MYKKIVVVIVGLALSASFGIQSSYGESTVIQSTTQTVKSPAKSRTATVETTKSTVVITPAIPRPVYDQATLKKMSDTLCVEGFSAKVGNENKNVCFGKATAPDIAYSCLWMKKGESAFPTTREGPCNLDFAEHAGTIIITKGDYKSRPPLAYGTKIECCFRAASGKPSTSSSTSTTSAPLKK